MLMTELEEFIKNKTKIHIDSRFTGYSGYIVGSHSYGYFFSGIKNGILLVEVIDPNNLEEYNTRACNSNNNPTYQQALDYCKNVTSTKMWKNYGITYYELKEEEKHNPFYNEYLNREVLFF